MLGVKKIRYKSIFAKRYYQAQQDDVSWLFPLSYSWPLRSSSPMSLSSSLILITNTCFGTVTTLILEIINLKHREIKSLTQSQEVRRWHSAKLYPRTLPSKIIILLTPKGSYWSNYPTLDVETSILQPEFKVFYFSFVFAIHSSKGFHCILS